MNRNGLAIFLFSLFYTALTFFVSSNPFFWDTTQLGSQHAHWFYINNFKYLLFPNDIDSGNTPTFGIYLALVWKLFGRSLTASHFAMLPFLLGIVLQIYLLCKRFLKEDSILWGMILLLAQPTLLAQSILISPDVILVFFYLLSLNAILKSNRMLLAVSLLGLGSISLRGIMCVAMLFVCDALLNTSFKGKKWPIVFFKQGLSYIPVSIMVLTWLVWHYASASWVGYHSGSPWAASFLLVSPMMLIRNFFILGWRLIDFGMIVWFIVLAPILIVIYKRYKGKVSLPKYTITLLILVVVPLIIFTIVLTPYSELLGHRYLLPVYITLSLFVLYHIDHFFESYKKAIYGLILIVTLSGHFWVYPEKIAMGWDATLAHYPYYKLRNQALYYFKENNIAVSEVGVGRMSAYCNYLLDLTSDTACFSEADLNKKKYILYSNIYNDYSDTLIDSLKTQWTLQKEFKSPTVFLRLYRKQ